MKTLRTIRSPGKHPSTKGMARVEVDSVTGFIDAVTAFVSGHRLALAVEELSEEALDATRSAAYSRQATSGAHEA